MGMIHEPVATQGLDLNLIKTKFINSNRLPLVIEPTNPSMNSEQFSNLLIEYNTFFKKSLLKYGGLLFRNFPVKDENDFSKVIKNLGTGNFLNYIGGDSPRNIIKEGIYTSTEAPPWLKIPLHNELSFVKNFPSHIYFYCHTAPIDKGETTLADARKIFKAVDPKIKQIFIEKKIKYMSHYYQKSKLMEFINKLQPSHKSWLQVFETDNKQNVEKLCRENEFAFKWNQNDWIEISQTRPATLKHPITKEDVWFNQAHLYDLNSKLLGFWRYLGAKILYCRKHMRLHEVFFADGTPIPRQYIYHLLDVLEANTIYNPWEKGDVLVLDNILAMHGRAPFTGKRRVLAAMTG
jgi:alpha-ketoglutarate-dependent taurine dioxygenase